MLAWVSWALHSPHPSPVKQTLPLWGPSVASGLINGHHGKAMKETWRSGDEEISVKP